MAQKLYLPQLILMRGLPGSGKSYIAKALQDKIGTDTVVILDPDAIDFESSDYVSYTNELRTDGIDEKLFPYRYLRSKAYSAALVNKIIIWNQAFTNAGLVERTLTNVIDYANSRTISLKGYIVEVNIDASIAKARITERANAGLHDVPVATFERFLADYSPMKSDMYPIIQLDGMASTESLIEKLLCELASEG